MRKILFFFNICAALCLIISYLCPWVNPEKIRIISLFGLLFPFWIACNFLFVIYWLISKPKFSLLSILTIALGWNSIQGLVQFQSEEQKGKENLKVMTYNVRGLHLSPKDKKTVASMDAYFKGHEDMDVICIQEKRKASKSIINTFLKDYDTVESPFGMAIFSKFPFIDKGRIKVGGNTEEAVWADIKHPNGKIFRVYSYHLSSNLISKTTDAIIKDPNLSEAKTWNKIKGILANYSRYTIMRKRQLDVLMDHVRAAPYPVIMAGDMNDVPQSYVNRLSRKRRQDTFRKKGTGLGVSFGGKYPFLRIDYIIPNQKFEVIDHTVDPVKYSDHYPVYASLRF